MDREIEYGKAAISFYRTYASPLAVRPIPGSPFTARDNVLFAALVDVRVFGRNFLAAYTEGDNTQVVATDTMKNFVYATALEFPGSTLEAFAAFLARRFLETYPVMDSLEITVREQPFAHVGAALFDRLRDDVSTARVRAARLDDAVAITEAESGREDVRLVKLTGSSFTRFARDEFTTLPETVDRPLFVHLDVHWRYGLLPAGTGELAEEYVHADQIRDLVRHTFDDFNSRSIQHLVDEMGRRILARLPQLAEVRFDAQNRTWETALVSERDPKTKVYIDPPGTYGKIVLVLRR
jgi:urate oxidase / 2-oxo-4-hydroxy-4-carboxy-5-ureidoimidazoline decarboxylase